jgi:SAM-dependent methyltransferase
MQENISSAISIIHYQTCPGCGSSLIVHAIDSEDHSVSKKKFEIWQCNNCSLRFTQDVPDLESIGIFYKSENYISHTNTSKGLVNRIYQLVRKRTLRQKAGLVEKITGKSGGTLLDLGSGVGAFVAEMNGRGWKVTGIEPDPDARTVARDQFHVDLCDSAEVHQLRDESFDAITLWHVLEHMHNLHLQLQTLRRLLKQDGKLIIALPNYTSLDAKIFGGYWAAYDVPRHLYHFSPLAMRMLLEKMNFKLIKKIPMWYDSYYISLLSSKYKSGRTDWPSALMTGLRSNRKAKNNNDHASSLIYVAEK